MIPSQATAERWNARVRFISERTAESYPNSDPEDLFSALCGLLLTLEWAILEELDPDGPGMTEFLFEEAAKLAWETRKEQLRLTSQYFYRVPDVQEIMETVFDRTDWPSGFTPKDAKDGERDRMAALEVRMDCLDAYKGLTEGLREALILRYHDKIIPERGSTAERQLRYALKAMTDRMNSYYV